MPLNLPNFLNAPILSSTLDKGAYSGMENLIPNFLKSYQAPTQIRQEKEINTQKIEAQKIANALLQKYGEQEKMAKLALMGAQAQHYANPMTSTQRDLMAAFGGSSSPEFKQALKQQYGVFDQNTSNIGGAEGIPESAIGPAFQNLPKNEQLFATKEMHKDLNLAKGMTDSLKVLDQMDEIVDEHPELWNSFTLMMSDPNNEAGIKEYLRRNVAVNEEQRAAIDKFRKLSGDLVVKGGEALGGGQRFTDARQALLTSIKPDIQNTPEANKFVIQNMKDLMSEGPEWQKALRYGLKNRVKIIRDPEAFKREKPTEMQMQEYSQILPQSNEELLRMLEGEQ